VCMRGMYMKVLVVPSERIAIMAKLTVGAATYFSQFWGAFHETEDLVKDVLDYSVNQKSNPSQLRNTLEETKMKLERAQVALAELHNDILVDGNLQTLFNGLGPFESVEAEIAELKETIVKTTVDLDFAKKVEDSVRELEDHMSECLKLNEATGASTPLGPNFEMLLETAFAAVDAARTQRGKSSSDEDDYTWF
jgi:hypothetical protein